ncbi:nucleotidyltransferase domain-containing protein [Terricaulis sp.]|uniref:nucleotidyltransferase domain-containing protein n=1 Tax=Terricaulis sp. TaxID=2768686 RepID=UPI003784B114
MPDALPDEPRAEVMRRLAAIERDERVRILLAVESGSRAWGFHSPDSDFDARFLYVRREDEYLSLFAPRDVIETPLEGLFDVNGWDLAKAMRLIIKGNSVIHEWLASPLIYMRNERFAAAITPLAREWRTTYADAHHYYGLLATQRGRHIEGRELVNLKKYFYAVRPALALQWLRERSDPPPMDLPGLLAGVRMQAPALAALERLRAAKKAASEVGEGPRIAELDDYIEAQAQWGMEAKGRAPTPDPVLVAKSDALFRAAVRGEFD